MNIRNLSLFIVAVTLLTVASFILIPKFTSAEKRSSTTKRSGTAVTSFTKNSDRQRKSTSTITPVIPPAIPTDPAITQPPATTAPALPSLSPHSLSLYVNPALSQAGRPAEIANQPTATWLGAWSGDIHTAANNVVSAASASGTIATFVAYNIPVRDCGGYSAGGANSSTGYKEWIRQVAAGIGDRQAIVILEPDALGHITCLSAADQAARYANLSDAVNVLATQTKAFIYLDAGHSNWISASTMAERLKQANVAQARGFALNVSNFHTSASNISYGDQIAAATGKKYVIDTSRNGNGSSGEWCNPRGRALGERPTTNTSGNLDAYLWVKVPGESDGACNGGPNAGEWWEDYAQELIRNAQ